MDKDNKKRNRSTKKKGGKDDDDDEECMEVDSEDEIKFEKLAIDNKKLKNTGEDMDLDPIQVEFLFSELRDTYFHHIKNFIQPCLDYEVFNISEMADIILKQKEIGTAIKTELEEDIGSDNVDLFALCTLIKFNNYADLTFVKQFKAFIIGKAKNSLQTEELDNLNNILENKSCGLLINERSMNLPLALIPPLLNLLSNDITDYKEDNPNDNTFNVDYIVIMSRCIKTQPTKTTKKVKSDKKEPEFIFYKYEEEEFIKNAEISFSYKIPLQEKNLGFLENSNEPQHKFIAVLKMAKFFKLIENMQK